MNLPLKTMMKSKYKHFLCRLCLCKNGTLCDIHCNEEGHGFTAADCMSDLLRFNVSKTDGYPQLVCLECLNKLYDFKKFKERCQNAKSRFELDFHSNVKFLHARKSDEKEDHQEMTLLEGDSPQTQNIQKDCSDTHMKQHVEEKEISCEYYVKVEPDQALDLQEDDEEEEEEICQRESLSPAPLCSDDCKELSFENINKNPYTKETIKENHFRFKEEDIQALDGQDEEEQERDQWDPICLAPLRRNNCSKSPYSTNPYAEEATKQDDLSFEEENTQESSKQFEKESVVEEETDNLAASPRSPSFPSCICIIESDGERGECITNQPKVSQKKKTHTKKDKGEKRVFRCEICEKTYNHKSSLTTHMNIHLGLKPFVCEVCKMGFLQSSKLKLHTIRKHAEKTFQCSLCPRRFPTENSLARHTRTHREHRPFQCSLCMCGFYTEKALERHTARHAVEVPFQCDHCGKVFDHKRKILWHIRRSHMVKPHACSICNRRFIKESGLKEHMTLHTGEKNYMCEVCGKAFRRKQCLTIHERVHTGEKPYLCELCNKRFTQRGSLVAHMKMHSR